MVERPEASLASSRPLRVSLVNLQKLTLWAWVAPASMRILAPAQNTRGLPERRRMTFTCGCSKRSRSMASESSMSAPEAQEVGGVGELDVDAEVVGVELELVAFEQRALLVDIHRQGRYVAIDRELPMPVLRGIGLEVDPALAVAQLAFRVGHRFLATDFLVPSFRGDVAFVVIAQEPVGEVGDRRER